MANNYHSRTYRSRRRFGEKRLRRLGEYASADMLRWNRYMRGLKRRLGL
ncbi:hypothetical protein ES703_36717 [subsurface metagenome]